MICDDHKSKMQKDAVQSVILYCIVFSLKKDWEKRIKTTIKNTFLIPLN